MQYYYLENVFFFFLDATVPFRIQFFVTESAQGVKGFKHPFRQRITREVDFRKK